MARTSTIARRRLRRAETLTAALLTAWPPRVQRIERELTVVARGWGDGYLAAGRGRSCWRAALADADALASAHVLVRAALPASITAHLVEGALTAWCFGAAASELDHAAPAHQRTPEVLLAALAARPAAACAVLSGWEPEALDLLLAWDPSAVGPFLEAATTGLDELRTGELLGRVLAHTWLAPGEARHPGASGERLVTWLARLIGPWQLHVIAGSPGWNWRRPDGLEALRWIATDETGAAMLHHAPLR